MFKGGLKQDAVVCAILNHKRQGFFVDVGATHEVDGEGSNTYALEKQFGWKGILVEPHPERAAEIKPLREAPVYEVAVFDRDGGHLQLESDTMGGVEECQDESLWRAWMRLAKISVPWKKKFNTITVPRRSLTSLLLENDAPEVVDYLSVDTEGSEYHILAAIDFGAHEFKIINYEHNFVSRVRSKITRLLESNGYVFAGCVGCDDFFVHNSLDIDHCTDAISRANADRLAGDPGEAALFRAYELYDTLKSNAIRRQFALRTAAVFVGSNQRSATVRVKEVEDLYDSLPKQSSLLVQLANRVYWVYVLGVIILGRIKNQPIQKGI
jgi:FkbM family methyltransferase